MRRATVAAGAASLLAVLAAGCVRDPDVFRQEFLAFGTHVRVEIRDADPAVAAAATARIERFFRSVDRDWYAWGGGELSRVNDALARGEPALLSPSLGRLVGRALDLSRRSGGLFDPAIADLVALWGFDDAGRTVSGEPPGPDAVERLRRETGTAGDLVLEGDRLTARRPLRLDMGGIAKGTALEEVRRILHQAGIGSALVSVGDSSVLAVGERGARRWRVGVRQPRGSRLAAGLELLPGEALSTSGDYERFRMHDGQRLGHVLDPRTGWPASSVAAVTVIAPDAELADAASTALMVAGPDALASLAPRLGITAALLLTTDGRRLEFGALADRLVPHAEAP